MLKRVSFAKMRALSLCRLLVLPLPSMKRFLHMKNKSKIRDIFQWAIPNTNCFRWPRTSADTMRPSSWATNTESTVRATRNPENNWRSQNSVVLTPGTIILSILIRFNTNVLFTLVFFESIVSSKLFQNQFVDTINWISYLKCRSISGLFTK